MTDEQARWIRTMLIPRILKDRGRAFAMDRWVARYPPGNVLLADGVERKVPACGTVACIGGWTQLLGPPGRIAWKTLGLTRAQSRVLFYGAYPLAYITGVTWPEPYYSQYRKAKTPAAKAKVAARLLKRVARTRGRCLNLTEGHR